MRFVTADERPDLMERYADEAEELWPSHMGVRVPLLIPTVRAGVDRGPEQAKEAC